MVEEAARISSSFYVTRNVPTRHNIVSHKVPVRLSLSLAGQHIINGETLHHRSQYFLPAGRAQSAWPAGPKITLPFLRLYVCASALITCAIITSRTLLPCNLTLVDFGNLDGCFA